LGVVGRGVEVVKSRGGVDVYVCGSGVTVRGVRQEKDSPIGCLSRLVSLT